MTSLNILFGISVVATLASLAALVTTGLMGERKMHLTVFFPTAFFLLAAIYFAERLGQVYRFSPTVLAVHLPIAVSTVVMLVPTIVTGAMRWRNPARVRAHRYCVIAFLTLAILALGTGILLLVTPQQST
ncbi:MAG: hypothetical protein U1E76_14750 [Planctomycetota bacterium]